MIRVIIYDYMDREVFNRVYKAKNYAAAYNKMLRYNPKIKATIRNGIYHHIKCEEIRAAK